VAVDANGNPIPDVTAPAVTGGSGIGDLLAGIGGAPVNRAALGGTIANGQAMAGLRTAQTENALLSAQQTRDREDALSSLNQNLLSMKKPDGSPLMAPADAQFITLQERMNPGSAEHAVAALQGVQNFGATQTLGSPTATPQAQTLAQQQLEHKVAPLETAPAQFVAPAAGPNAQPNIQVSPMGAADINAKNAMAAAAAHRAEAPFNQGIGGFQVSPELQDAVTSGRLDPSKLNSRTVQIYDQMAKANPQMDFNAAISSAALQRNATLRQRTATIESLPANIQNMVQLGSKLSYSDAQVVGMAQKWLAGQSNDPDLAAYMGVRNDTLLNLASVMRGVGMSDQAHQAEIEAASPTMSPAALNGWAKGQLPVIQRRQEQYQELMHPHNLNGPGTTPSSSAAQTPEPATPGSIQPPGGLPAGWTVAVRP
jgi:hypothetical protein